MNRYAHKRLAWGIILATLPLTTLATTGYFQHGYGVKSRGVAGAGVAFPQDAMDAAINPANMVFVGNDQQLGIGIFAPTRKYTVSGQPSGAPGTFGLFPGTVKSENEAFLIPNYARNWMLNGDSSIGLTVYANGGMNTEWKDTDVDPFGFGDIWGWDSRCGLFPVVCIDDLRAQVRPWRRLGRERYPGRSVVQGGRAVAVLERVQ